MEEVCEPENLKEALQQVKANKGSAGIEQDDRRSTGRLLETALASHSGTTVEWNLRTKAGPSGGNPEAGRRCARARHSDRVGQIHPASGDAGSAKTMGPDIFPKQLRFSTRSICSSSCSPSAAVHRGGLWLGR